MGIAALVLGIVGTIFSLIPLLFWVGVPLALIGLILGVVGRKQATVNGQPTGMATAGMVLSIIGLCIGVSMWVLCSVCANNARKGFEKALNDPEFKKRMNDPKLNKDFDDAFNNALKDAAKNQAQPAGAPPPPATPPAKP